MPIMSMLGRVFLVAALCLCGCNSQSLDENFCKNIGAHSFMFPKEIVAYSDEGRADTLLTGALLDSDQGIVLRLPEVRLIDSLGTIGEIVSVSKNTSAPENIRSQKSVFLDMWIGEGEYRNRFILFDEEVGLYRLYIAEDVESMWEYLRDDPTKFSGEVPAPESQWVASCNNTSRPLVGATEENVCKSPLYVDGLRIEYYSSSSALSDLEKVHSGIKKIIWQYKLDSICK